MTAIVTPVSCLSCNSGELCSGVRKSLRVKREMQKTLRRKNALAATRNSWRGEEILRVMVQLMHLFVIKH
jgi:hypothetical protein